MSRKPVFLAFAVLAVASVAHSAEEIPPGEEAATRRIVELIETSVREAALKDGHARRDAHAKHHGCVKAEVEVLPGVPAEFRRGIFAARPSYPAWIRFSNGSGKSQDDREGDGRGMAIKVLDVESESGTQDFLMINHPVFFVRNAEDYVDFQQALSQGNIMKFFFPGLNPLKWRFREMGIARAIQAKEVRDPLAIDYFSLTPYALGEAEVKYVARPCVAPGKSLREDREKSDSPNFLREALAERLVSGAACFELRIQARTRPEEMPIEDPTVEWKGGREVPLARIRIPSQEFESPEQMRFCENLSFTPWHSAAEHRPLGGINRVRKTVYEAISRLRHELNGEPRREPVAGEAR